MPTERINIVISSTGGRQVVRTLNGIATSANTAARGIRILQNAFFVLGAAGLVRGLTRQLDILTEFENRLRLTADSAANAEAVQQQLFEVARRSRTEFESVAEIYSRAALSVRELGISQQETIRFTESLAKASIISGASAREANAALVQLSQGLASNRLSGDELRSVLEQLPFVADVIARQLGITRGELREFGRDGRISAGVVLEAFRNAREEIDELFDNIQPTISQALTVARTNFQQFLDSFDDNTGFSAALANLIVVLSENIERLVNITIIAGGALAAAFAGNALASLGRYIETVRAGIGAQRAAAAAEVQRRASIAQTLQLRQAETAQNVTRLKQEGALLLSKQRLLQAEVAANRFTVQGNLARNVQTGQFVSLTAATDRLNASKAALARTEFALVNTERALTAERGRLTAVTNAATAANGRYAVATAASTAGLARFGALGRGLSTVLGLIRTGLLGIVALLGGPFAAAVAVVAGLTLAFVQWGNAIQFNVGGELLGLKDLAIATFRVIRDRVNSLVQFFQQDLFGGLSRSLNDALNTMGIDLSAFGEFFGGVFQDAVSFAVDVLIGLPATVVGIINGIISAISVFPANFRAIFQRAANLALSILTSFANKAIGIINSITGALSSLAGTRAGNILGVPEGGIAPIEEITPDLIEVEEAGLSVAGAFREGFQEGSQGVRDAFTSLGNDIRNEAIAIRDARELAAGGEGGVSADGGVGTGGAGAGGGGGGGGGGTSRDFASEIANLRQQIDLERQYGLQKLQTQEILRIENALKRQLTETERQLVSTLVEKLEISKIQGQILQEINGPQEKLRLTQQALNELFAQGAITLGQYNDKLRETYIAAQRAQGTLAGGFRAAIAGSIQSASEFGQAIGNELVNAVGALSDEIVNFAETGEFNIKKVFRSLFRNLLKLATQRILLQLLGGVVGVPGGGFGGPLGGGGALGFSSGGSIMPSGPGSTDTQPVAFMKRPDERVDILTPRQQRKQAEAMQGKGTTVVQAPAPNVVVQITPEDIANALSGEEGDRMIVRGLERNQNSARAALGG